MNATAICALVLLFATAIACFNYLYLGLQRSIGVLLLSLGLSLVAIAIDRLTGSHIVAWYHVAVGAADLPRVFLDGVLALLLFAGSLHVNVRELTQRIGAILVLSTGSVIVATIVFGLGIWLVFRLVGITIMPGWCLVIGAILAPTDAVVVESLLRKAPLPPSLRAVIAGRKSVQRWRRAGDVPGHARPRQRRGACLRAWPPVRRPVLGDPRRHHDRRRMRRHRLARDAAHP